MHQDKIVTVFFIKRVPQYVFRQLYCHHLGFFSSELQLKNTTNYTNLYEVVITYIYSLLWRNLRIGLCNISLKKNPDDGNITAEIRIGALFQ
jgi:hypothetical protein